MIQRSLLILGIALGSAAAQAAGDPAAGEQKAAPCAACHGANGMSPSPAFPHLAGQHASYLVHSLEQYRDGQRGNAIMAGQAAGLSDQDILDLAAYFAAQSGLYTPAYAK